eukprot:1726129-Rhodomonas_salina.2
MAAALRPRSFLACLLLDDICFDTAMTISDDRAARARRGSVTVWCWRVGCEQMPKEDVEPRCWFANTYFYSKLLDDDNKVYNVSPHPPLLLPPSLPPVRDVDPHQTASGAMTRSTGSVGWRVVK